MASSDYFMPVLGVIYVMDDLPAPRFAAIDVGIDTDNSPAMLNVLNQLQSKT